MTSRLKSNSLIIGMALAGFTLILLAMTGCSGDGGPSDAVVPGPSSTDGPTFIDTPQVSSGLSSGVGKEVRAGSTTMLVKAKKGGTVTYGRFTVEIPANALEEDTYITVRKPGGPYLICELEPHGIQFNKPVQLTMDVEGLSTEPYTDWTIFWLDETISLWVDLDAVFDDDEHELRVDLEHFSAYGGGRAGW